MSDKKYIRLWHLLDADEVKKHLLIVGHLTADCANCKQIGIDYKKEKTCPGCKTAFRYIGSRAMQTDKHPGGAVKKIRDLRPDLIFIDLGDFRHASEQGKARDFFK